MIDNEEIENIVKFFKKKIKKNIYKISVIQNSGLITIKKLLVNNVFK